MIKIMAYYNHGQWLATCPICGPYGENKVVIGDEMFVCGNCYPEKMTRKLYPGADGGLVFSYDKKKQDHAKAVAYANDEVYELVFPGSAREIEAVLQLRMTEHQSWLPGETLEDLKKENDEMPLLAYIKKRKPKKPKKHFIGDVTVPELEPEMARRIK